jgi:ATP-dependent DNA helicase RecQ
MDKFEQILVKHWGYANFRSIQKEVIASVCQGRDTLALMPTGGGKSITFQVAALASDGLCIVVTPLIALMKDQVDNLKKKGIKAAYLHSGMRLDEMSVTLDNCAYGGYKFLYVSPERLGTEIFQARLAKLKVNLIAVDEAHCISQWGFDFRPSYLKIAEIRKLLPGVAVLAATATATPKVASEIQEKLLFSEANLMSMSFERKNLRYIVRKKEDKLGYLAKVLAKNKGAGIVYARNRRKTKEVAEELVKLGIKADYYHAGLQPHEREDKQNKWKHGQYVMVCTNAFGMGIDKPDVRYVVHIDLPESPEAYFQEAGRAGRDEKEAYAVQLFTNADLQKLRDKTSKMFPGIDKVKQVYSALCNYFQVPIGYGKGSAKEFDIADFCKKFKQEAIETLSCIKILQQAGYMELSESADVRSRMRFIVNRDSLYAFQVKNKSLDGFVKLVLRTYSGIFTDYVKIDETSLAAKAGVAAEIIKKLLVKLDKLQVINYYQASKFPLVVYTTERLSEESLYISKQDYQQRMERYISRAASMEEYVTGLAKCRSQFLLRYFGQDDAPRCGICDVCASRNELDMSKLEFDTGLSYIKTVSKPAASLVELADNGPLVPEKIIKIIEWLLENGKLKQEPGGLLAWHSD